jgi:hypothetical protein
MITFSPNPIAPPRDLALNVTFSYNVSAADVNVRIMSHLYIREKRTESVIDLMKLIFGRKRFSGICMSFMESYM